LDRTNVTANDTVHVKLDVANTGKRDGDEVVQVYFRHVKSAAPQPMKVLCGFQRVPTAAKQTARVDIAVPVKELRYWDTTKKDYVVEPGDYEMLVGAASDDIRSQAGLRVEGK
jgi:beta-glucosidase